MNTKKIYGIQLLRGICILLTLCAHLPLMTKLFDAAGLPAPYIIGVSIFYAISGWIIAHVTHNLTAADIPAFFIKRLCRLLPILYCSLAFTLLLSAILPHQDYINQFYPIFHQAWQIVLQNILFSADTASYFGIAAPLSLAGLWSISVEIKYYFVYGFILIFHNKIRTMPLLTLLLVLFGLRWKLIAGNFSFAYSHFFFVELFILGALSYRFKNIFYRNNFLNYFAWLWLFLFPILSLKNNLFFAGYLLFCISAIYIVNYFATNDYKLNWLNWLGERSYILYVFHFQFLAVAGLIGQRLYLNTMHPWLYNFLLIGSLFAGLPVVEWLHYFVEKRGIQSGHKLLQLLPFYTRLKTQIS